jgi:chromosome segregation ATPase
VSTEAPPPPAPPPLPTATRHSTADIYQRLVDVEVKSLLARVTELTSNVDSVFGEVSELMLRTEEMLNRLEAISSGLNFNRAEITDLKHMLVQHTRELAELSARITEVERRQHLYG